MPAMLMVLRQPADRVEETRREAIATDGSMRAVAATVNSDAPFARIKPDRRKTERRTTSPV
jgi:hypothetical protein